MSEFKKIKTAFIGRYLAYRLGTDTSTRAERAMLRLVKVALEEQPPTGTLH